MIQEVLNIVNDLFPTQVMSEDIEEVKAKRTEGKSLGASIALYMRSRTALAFSDLGERVTTEPDLGTGWIKERFIAILYYSMLPNAFLEAEEVIKSGEPEQNSYDEELEFLADKIGATLGRNPLEGVDNSKLIIAETQLYLRDLRRGHLLIETGSPLAVIENVTHGILNGLNSNALKASQEHNTTARRNILIATVSVVQGQLNFNKLYNQLDRM